MQNQPKSKQAYYIRNRPKEVHLITATVQVTAYVIGAL